MKKLSEFYAYDHRDKGAELKYACCDGCGKVYIDDILFLGNIPCPNPDSSCGYGSNAFMMRRGISPDEAFRILLKRGLEKEALEVYENRKKYLATGSSAHITKSNINMDMLRHLTVIDEEKSIKQAGLRGEAIASSYKGNRKYLCLGGYVFSADGDKRYISPHQIPKLYHVPREQCIFAGVTHRHDPNKIDYPLGVEVLTPRSDGRYQVGIEGRMIGDLIESFNKISLDDESLMLINIGDDVTEGEMRALRDLIIGVRKEMGFGGIPFIIMPKNLTVENISEDNLRQIRDKIDKLLGEESVIEAESPEQERPERIKTRDEACRCAGVCGKG